MTYRKILLDHPSCPPEEALAAAVKSMNDTVGPEGFVPSALVFGEFPRVHVPPDPPGPRPSLESRARVANSARQEMERQMAVLGLNHTRRPCPSVQLRAG